MSVILECQLFFFGGVRNGVYFYQVVWGHGWLFVSYDDTNAITKSFYTAGTRVHNDIVTSLVVTSGQDQTFHKKNTKIKTTKKLPISITITCTSDDKKHDMHCGYCNKVIFSPIVICRVWCFRLELFSGCSFDTSCVILKK